MGFLGSRVRTQVSVFVSVLTLVALLTQFGAVRSQPGTAVGAAVSTGLAALLGLSAVGVLVGAALRRRAVARGAAAAQVAVFAALVATWPLLWGGAPIDAPILWFASFGGGTLLLLAVFVRGPALWGTFALLHGASLVEHGFATATEPAAAAFGVSFGLVYMGILLYVTRALVATADAVDADVADRVAERAPAAVARARRRQSALLDGVIHDRVLAVLAAVERLGPSAVTRRSAREATGLLRGLSRTPTARRAVTDARLAREVRALADGVGADVVAGPADAGARRRTRPAHVADEFVAAVGEVLANARAHGGPRVRVATAKGPDELVVTVHDDGPVFDVDRALASGVGLRVSVVGRVEALGGTVEVTSREGAGTTVRLAVPAGTGTPGRGRGGRWTSAALWDVVRIDRRAAVAGAVLFAGVLTVDALVATAGGVRPLGPLVAQVVIAAAGAAAVLARRTGALGLWGIAALAAGAAAVGLSALDGPGTIGFLRLVEAPMVVLAVVLLRGGRVAAWTGAAVVSAAYLGSLLRGGTAVDDALGEVMVGLFLVIGSQVLEVLVTPVRRSTADVHRRAIDGRVAALASRAALAERSARADRVLAGVGGVLDRIAVAVDDDEDLRVDARLAEAGLRDHIRARALVSPEVDAGVGRARRRGVKVLLLDDARGDLDDELLGRARTLLLDELADAEPGSRVVARVHTSGAAPAFGLRVREPDGTVRRRTLGVVGPGPDEPGAGE